MKATLSVLEEVIIIVAAFALCILLLSLVFNMWPTESKTSKGTPTQVSNFLEDKIEECLKRHSYGLDPKSDICGEFEIESDGTIPSQSLESSIDCSKAAREDCIDVYISRQKTFVSVTYLASERKVVIREFGCFSDSDCDDSEICTQDTCRFPGTTESSCTYANTCTTEVPTSCESDNDCFPGECCHATSCVLETDIPNCDGVMCTEECREGTMDCGQGKCACREGKCVAELL